MQEKDLIVISNGKLPWWRASLAILIFALALAFLVVLIPDFMEISDNDDLEYSLEELKIFVLLIFFGVTICMTKTIFLDIQNQRFKELYAVGPIKRGIWKPIKKIEYISVFLQLLEDENYDLEVNLWYDRNKHVNIHTYHPEEEEEAMQRAKEIAEQLATDLLDARTPNDYKWVE